MKLCNPVVGDGGRIEEVVSVPLDRVSVVSIEPAGRTEPHKTEAVLHDDMNGTLRKPFLDGEMIEIHALPLRRGGQNHERNTNGEFEKDTDVPFQDLEKKSEMTLNPRCRLRESNVKYRTSHH
jgi:hypothetical protein